jgi:hypothetical protein
MGRLIVILFLNVSTAFILTGCYTVSQVNFGNNSGSAVKVQSSQTGKEIGVPSGKFRKFPHAAGDLIVTTEANGQFKLTAVAPPFLNGYLKKEESFWGPGYVTLNVVLESNMELYVLSPNDKALDRKVQQPDGYPKVGHKM